MAPEKNITRGKLWDHWDSDSLSIAYRQLIDSLSTALLFDMV